MKLKVGDKVTIRKDLVVDKKYKKCRFAEKMVTYKGKQAIITSTNDAVHGYHLDIDDFWWWTDEMFEPTIDNLKVGDVLLDEDEEERMVLGICGRVYFLSIENDFEVCNYGGFTLEEIKKDFTLKSSKTTLTKQQIANKFGVDIKNLRIEK